MGLHHQVKQKAKRLCKFFAVLLFFTFLAVLGINLYVVDGTKTKIFNEVSAVPERETGLVMGTDLLRFNGSTNLHFFYRTEGAAKCYLAGKVSHLLISGNRNNHGFNEVLGMEGEILLKDVPKNVLILDFEGNSTWQSVRRAKQIYQLQKVTIITDAFHAPRAIFLCRHFGIDAVAFCYGEESFGFWSARYYVREWFARVKAFAQVLIDFKSS